MPIEFYQSVHSYICAGQYAANVLHWQLDNTGSTDDWEAARQIALDMVTPITGLVQKFVDCMPANCFASSLRVRRVAPTGGNTAPILFAALDFPGAFPAEVEISSFQESGCLILLPDSAAGLFGRVFVPGVPEGQVINGRFSNAYETAINDLKDKIVVGGTVAAGIYLPVVFNRTTLTGPVVQNGYLSIKVGTQDRRRVPV